MTVTKTGAHEAPKEKWYRRKLTRFGIPVWGFLAAFILMAGTALALILARAEFQGAVSSGTAELAFVDPDGGSLDATFAEYDATNTEDITNGVTVPAGVTCDATVDGSGDIQLTVDGLFPGEGCLFDNWDLSNLSTIDLSNIQWDYNGAPFGADLSDQPVEMWLGEFDGTKIAPVDPATYFGTLAAGTSAAGPTIVVELPDTTTADGSSLDATGVALVGENTSR